MLLFEKVDVVFIKIHEFGIIDFSVEIGKSY